MSKLPFTYSEIDEPAPTVWAILRECALHIAAAILCVAFSLGVVLVLAAALS
jgi:hypothetical protein